MSRRTMHTLGKSLAKDIGKHHRISEHYSSDRYDALRQKSDAAVSQLKYLIRYLDSRDDAVTLANAAGCPGYINFR